MLDIVFCGDVFGCGDDGRSVIGDDLGEQTVAADEAIEKKLADSLCGFAAQKSELWEM